MRIWQLGKNLQMQKNATIININVLPYFPFLSVCFSNYESFVFAAVAKPFNIWSVVTHMSVHPSHRTVSRNSCTISSVCDCGGGFSQVWRNNPHGRHSDVVRVTLSWNCRLFNRKSEYKVGVNSLAGAYLPSREHKIERCCRVASWEL